MTFPFADATTPGDPGAAQRGPSRAARVCVRVPCVGYASTAYQAGSGTPLTVTLSKTSPSMLPIRLVGSATPSNVQSRAVNPAMWSVGSPLTSNTSGALVHDDRVMLNGPKAGGKAAVWVVLVIV